MNRNLFGSLHPSRNDKNERGQYENTSISYGNTLKPSVLWDDQIRMPLLHEFPPDIFPNYGKEFLKDSNRIVTKYAENYYPD